MAALHRCLHTWGAQLAVGRVRLDTIRARVAHTALARRHTAANQHHAKYTHTQETTHPARANAGTAAKHVALAALYPAAHPSPRSHPQLLLPPPPTSHRHTPAPATHCATTPHASARHLRPMQCLIAPPLERRHAALPRFRNSHPICSAPMTHRKACGSRQAPDNATCDSLPATDQRRARTQLARRAPPKAHYRGRGRSSHALTASRASTSAPLSSSSSTVESWPS